jgi:uncharacterized protein (DUF362 family)
MTWPPSPSETEGVGATDPPAHRSGRPAVSRRTFLGALTVPLLAGACRRPPYDAGTFSLPARSAVGLFPAGSYGIDLADVILRGFRELGTDLTNRRVLLKPNLVEYEPGEKINTHPLVVAGAAVACRRAGAAEVIVAEGPGHRRDIEYLLTATGLADHLKDLDVRFVDLNHDDVAMVPLRSSFTGLTALALPRTLLRSDCVISVPKLKTHHWAGMTCGMKNLFGVVPGAVYGWPKNFLHVHGLMESIVDLNATVRPHFVIADAVMAMEGDGPIMGTLRPLGFLAMGSDLAAVDATCARVIGLDPRRLPYLDAASRFLGRIDEAHIDQRGESPARYAARFDVIDALKGLRLGGA